MTYRIYRNMDDAPDYELLAQTQKGSWKLKMPSGKEYVMFKLTAQKTGQQESQAAVVTCSDAIWQQRLANQLKRCYILLKTEFLGQCYDFGLRVIDLVQRQKGKRG